MVQPRVVDAGDRAQQAIRPLRSGPSACNCSTVSRLHFELLGLLVDGGGQVGAADAAESFARRADRAAMDARFPERLAAVGTELLRRQLEVWQRGNSSGSPPRCSRAPVFCIGS